MVNNKLVIKALWHKQCLLVVSLFTWVIFSLLAFGLRGASVSKTGCSSGATRSSL